MVYFVQAEGVRVIKIGWCTADLRCRLSALVTGSPVTLRLIGLLEGTEADEHAIHERFRDYRSHGEWFFPSQGLIQFIRDHAVTGEAMRPFVMPKQPQNATRDFCGEIDLGASSNGFHSTLDAYRRGQSRFVD